MTKSKNTGEASLPRPARAQKRKIFKLWDVQDNFDGTANLVVRFENPRHNFIIRDIDYEDAIKAAALHNRLKSYVTRLEREVAKYDQSDEAAEIRRLLGIKFQLEESINARTFKNIPATK